jgi:hypothetical protein
MAGVMARDAAIVASLDHQSAIADALSWQVENFPRPPSSVSAETRMEFLRAQKRTLLQIGELNRQVCAGYRQQNKLLAKYAKHKSKL